MTPAFRATLDSNNKPSLFLKEGPSREWPFARPFWGYETAYRDYYHAEHSCGIFGARSPPFINVGGGRRVYFQKCEEVSRHVEEKSL
jgi:hypothetical protein